MTLAFSKSGIDALGSFDFVFDDIGFGPTSGSFRATDDSFGIGIPVIDVGLTFDYTVGARLVIEAHFDGGLTAVDYTLSEGSFVGQASLFQFNPAIRDGLEASGRALYRNSAIAFSTEDMAAVLGQSRLAVTAGAPAELSARIDYTLKLSARDFFLGVDLLVDEFGVSFGASRTLLDEAGSLELFRITAGDPLYEVTSGAFAGTYVTLPTLPDYSPLPPTTIQPGGLDGAPAIGIRDTANPFANLDFNIAQFITEKTAIPLAASLDEGPFSAKLELLRAQANLNLSVGQEQVFTPEAVRVRLELFRGDGTSTGKVLTGALGDDLAFDSANLGSAFVRAEYTLFGGLEVRTGLVLAGSLDLGLLAGSASWTGVGPDFDIGFGPLIPLPSPSFTSDLFTIITDREEIAFAPITRDYGIYSEADEIGTDAGMLHDLGASQTTPFDAKGGNDTIRGFAITADTIFGGTGNDLILGAARNSEFTTEDDLPGFIADDDRLFGGTGNDTIEAGNGDDLLDGGAGADLLRGGDGNDTLVSFGTDGVDELRGGNGVDTAIIIRSGTTQDWVLDLGALFPGSVSLTQLPDETFVQLIERWDLTTGFGNDSIRGGLLDDTLRGGWGRDTLSGGAGADSLLGGGGDDRLIYARVDGTGVDTIEGGTGLDTVVIATSGTAGVFRFNLTGNAALGVGSVRPDIIDVGNEADYAPLLEDGIERARVQITNGFGADGPVERLEYTNTSSLARNEVVGGAHADLIITGNNTDRLDGWFGADTLLAGGGHDTIVSWDADAMLDGGAGLDTLRLIRVGDTPGLAIDMGALAGGVARELADGTVIRNFEILFFDGTDKADVVVGGTRNDTIGGDGGNDSLNGGAGRDTVSGGDGNDTIVSVERPGVGGADWLDGGEGMDLLRLDWSAFTAPAGRNARALNISLVDSGATHTLATGTVVSGFERLEILGGAAGDTIFGGAAEVQTFVTQSFLFAGQVQTVRLPGPMLSDVISGGGGDDSLSGGGGRDIVSGGDGNDTIFTTLGDGDQIDGGDGFDTLIIRAFSKPIFTEDVIEYTDAGGVLRQDPVVLLSDGTRATGFESIIIEVLGGFVGPLAGTQLSDKVLGSDAADHLLGGSGNDTLMGGGGLDTLLGGLGDDILEFIVADLPPTPGDELAQLFGGGGNDIIRVNSSVMVSGGEGEDMLDLDFRGARGGITGDLRDTVRDASLSDGTRLFGIEQLRARFGEADDGLTLGFGRHVIDMGGGEDSVTVDRSAATTAQVMTARGEGAGIVFAFADGLTLSDVEWLTVEGGLGDDRFTVGALPDARPVRLTLRGGEGNDRLTGGGLRDLLDGGAGDDRLTGGDGNDTLLGDAGEDRLDGGLGADSMAGGDGDDSYVVDMLGDVAAEAPRGGFDRVFASLDWTLGAELEWLSLSGADDLNGTGNALANRLDGNAGANLLDGGEDNDTLAGGAGADTLLGGDGADRLEGGLGADAMTGGSGADLFRFLSAREAEGDVIRDFTPDEGDRLDLRAIDADEAAAGDQAFSWIESAGFSGTAGELRFLRGTLEGDVNGDGVADFQIGLTGVTSLAADSLLL